MKNRTLFFILIIILLFNFSFSLLCVNKDNIFDSIFTNSPRSFKVQPTNEVCYKYKLTKAKNKISLTFSVANSYTAEVVIYKSLYEMVMKDGNYINFKEKYLIVEDSFKEIDVSDYYDYVYIIIRDKKDYYFNDNLILYDSEVPIMLADNSPIEIKYFMSNNKYTFIFNSNKDLQFAYSVNTKSLKLVNLKYDGNIICDKKIDDEDIIVNLDNPDNTQKLLEIIIENNSDDNNSNQEFALVVYEKGANEFIDIGEDNIVKTFYIKNNLKQNFYFYADISKYKESSSINFKLDYISYKNKYINIISDIVYSDDSLNSDNFISLIPEENKLESSYDIFSDQDLKFYFNDNNQNKKYKYIIIKVEIKDYLSYYSPKYFTISLSKELETINLINIANYKTESIIKNTKDYIPLYFKLLLDPQSKYILTAPYQDYLLMRKGDLLENSKINKNYLNDEKDIIILSDISELTIQLFGNSLKDAIFYVEKINSNDVFIIENERSNNELSIAMNEDECKLQQKKYILGTYDKDIYEYGGRKVIKYWITKDGEMNLYYKNSISVEGQSLFPSLEKNKISSETSFILNNHIDLFTITCSKPGTLYLKPIMKTFSEITHIIGQNSISTISLNAHNEILQLSSPIKSSSQFLYLSIFALKGDNITLSPDTPGVFEETNLRENELFIQKIDINKYKSDELAIRTSLSGESASLEIIEVIHYNFSEYININNNKEIQITKNNFVKFIDKKVKKLKININELNEVPIYFGIIKLTTNDINYIPLAYNFKEGITKKNCSNNEYIEIDNKYYGEDDLNKKYQAFIFSIHSSKTDYEYKIKINEIRDKEGISTLTIIIIVIASILILFIIIIVILKIKKKKGINIETIKDNEPLYPNKKYILNDLMDTNEQHE